MQVERAKAPAVIPVIAVLALTLFCMGNSAEVDGWFGNVQSVLAVVFCAVLVWRITHTLRQREVSVRWKLTVTEVLCMCVVFIYMMLSAIVFVQRFL